MRASAVIALLSVPAVASAQPATTTVAIIEPTNVHVDVAVDITTDGGLAPPSTVAPASAPARQLPWEMVIRVGAASIDENFMSSESYARPSPSGTGMLAEVGIERRIRPTISLGVFGAVSTIRDHIGEYTYNQMDTSSWFLDVGARGRAHVGALFFGVTLGVEGVRNRYNYTNSPEDTRKSWNNGVLTGIEIGYQADARAGLAPELTLGLTRASIDMDDEIYPEQPVSTTTTSARATVGLRF